MKAIVFEKGMPEFYRDDVKIEIDGVNYIENRDGFIHLYSREKGILVGCYDLQIKGLFSCDVVRKIIIEDEVTE